MEDKITPSAGSLKAYRLGFLCYFGALLCAFPFTVLCEGFETLEESAKYLIPLLMAVGSIILMINGFNTSNQNAETTGWNNRMGVAGLLSLSFPILMYMALKGDMPEGRETLIIFALCFSIATVIIGYNYGKLPFYGASLAAKGAYWIFGGLLIAIISLILLEGLNSPSYYDYYDYYGNYEERMLSFKHKRAIYQAMTFVGATGILGGIFALLFGSKITATGAEQFEQEQAGQTEQPVQEQPAQQQPKEEQPKEEQPMVKGNFDDTTQDSGLSL